MLRETFGCGGGESIGRRATRKWKLLRSRVLEAKLIGFRSSDVFVAVLNFGMCFPMAVQPSLPLRHVTTGVEKRH